MSPPDAFPAALKASPGPPPSAAPPRRHTIAPGRDRLQSELLVWGWMIAVLPLALLLLWVQLTLSWQSGNLFTGTSIHAIWLSAILACIVLVVRAATPAAAAVGSVICFTTTIVTTQTSLRLLQTALPALLTLFVLTFAATRFGRLRKAKLGLADPRRERVASQIVANLGMASLVALVHGMTTAAAAACVAVLAEATADTLSSELGPLISGPTLLFTTMRRVAPGTDGAISLGGTLCGIAGAVLVAIAGVHALSFGETETKIVLYAAIFGFVTDSFLGATLERRGWIGNDLVNFLSTAVTGIIALGIGSWLLP